MSRFRGDLTEHYDNVGDKLFRGAWAVTEFRCSRSGRWPRRTYYGVPYFRETRQSKRGHVPAFAKCCGGQGAAEARVLQSTSDGFFELVDA